MAKIITDKEMFQIVNDVINKDELDDGTQYTDFLRDLAGVIAKHFGGKVGNSDYEGGKYYVAFHLNEEVPADGGIYKNYDKDATWKDGKEK